MPRGGGGVVGKGALGVLYFLFHWFSCVWVRRVSLSDLRTG